VRAVLVDTGPLYALFIPSDQHHQAAHSSLEQLQLASFTLLVPYPIVMETFSLLLRRIAASEAQRWLKEISEQVSILTPTDTDNKAALQRAIRYADQPVTLFDALLATLSTELSVPVWTNDKHFDVMKSEVWC
jgi:predicted nucleic acid-binding protein